MARALDVTPEAFDADGDEPAWGLFEDRESLERTMTSALRDMHAGLAATVFLAQRAPRT
jgi:hypothetical protein